MSHGTTEDVRISDYKNRIRDVVNNIIRTVGTKLLKPLLLLTHLDLYLHFTFTWMSVKLLPCDPVIHSRYRGAHGFLTVCGRRAALGEVLCVGVKPEQDLAAFWA